MTNATEQFATRYKIRFVESLGDGKDGRVLQTERGHAVKFCFNADVYQRELRAYQILRQRGIDEISGFQVPRLIRQDDSLLAIEMTVVQPPFVLDFASAYTLEEYTRLAFTDEVLDERESHWVEIFGDRWGQVSALCDAFTRETGLVLLDLSLNNIKFA